MLGPITATLEIVVSAALKRQVTVVSQSGASTGTAGTEATTLGSVRICFPNGTCMEFRQAQVKVTDDGPDGDRRLLISPLPTTTN